MTKRVVTNFDGLEPLGGHHGLHGTHNSNSMAQIDGTNLAVNDPVEVVDNTNADITWSGKMTGNNKANLKCSNKGKPPAPGRGRGIDSITVTVGSGGDTSDDFDTTVSVGP